MTAATFTQTSPGAARPARAGSNGGAGHAIPNNSSSVDLSEKWPLPQFESLSPEVKQQLFASDARDRLQITRELEELTHQYVQSEEFAEGGEFLPLSVWAVRGFDTSAIERLTKPCDRMTHPVLGDTFRLRGPCGAAGEAGDRGSNGSGFTGTGPKETTPSACLD